MNENYAIIITGLLALGAMLMRKEKMFPAGISTSGRNTIKAFEGLKLTASQDPTGTLDIGYGHVLQPGEIDEYASRTITVAEAEKLLDFDIAIAENCIKKHVRVKLNQNQYDALVSFVFNVGCGAFARSTLLSLLNKGDYENAAKEFDKWVFSKGIKLAGLVNRRLTEKRIFLT